METFVDLIDLRKLNKDELFKLRKQVVGLKLKGYSGGQIEALTGVRANRVSEIWRGYLKSGDEGLRPGMPGRKAGEKTLLSPSRERRVRKIFIEKTPDLVHMPYSLWTRQIASDFIRREYGVRLSLRCMTNYFKKWGFICQTPAKNAASRESTDFMRFMSEDYPAILRRAASENVGIYWYSETWTHKELPQNGNGNSERVRLAAAVTARGTARFMFFEGSMTQEKFLTLIGRLIRYADRKVFLVTADLRAFRGKKVEAWLKDREDRIEAFYHPPF